jgi:Protein of unknown function (DUF3168)
MGQTAALADDYRSHFEEFLEMTTASSVVQTAVCEALRNSVPVMAAATGVYDGPHPRAAFPYVSLGDGFNSDWSTKTAAGREIRVALTVWDDGESPARLHHLMQDVEDAVADVARDLDGWRVASVVFLRSMIARDPAGAWAGLVEHRIRVMATV